MQQMVRGEVGVATAELKPPAWLRRARDRVIPRVELAVDAMLPSYVTGMTPLVGVMEMMKMGSEARRDLLAARARVARAFVRVGRAIGQLEREAERIVYAP